MLHQNRMIANCVIKIVSVDRARSFAVVVQKTEHLLTRRRILRTVMQQRFDLLDRVFVARDFAEMLDTGFNRMGMRVVETRKNGFPSKVYFARARSGQAQHVRIEADGEKPAITDRDGLSLGLGLIYRPNLSVYTERLQVLLHVTRAAQARCRCFAENLDESISPPRLREIASVSAFAGYPAC
jgi:hypothetical protein